MDTKLPVSLQNTLPAQLQIDWLGLQSAHALPSVNSVRLNPKKYTSQFDQEEKIPWCSSGRYLQQRPSFTFDPLFHAGTYYVQEASSMFLEAALNQHVPLDSNLAVLDLCAAPGGKSTHIASLISDESLLICNEVIGTRVNILAENIEKWGYSNTWVSNNDPEHFSRVPDFFNMVFVDAPCSGSGLFRKIPDYCNSWNTDLVGHCAQRQKRILKDVYPSLAKNGLLVYMTCSLSQAENEDILDAMMQDFDVETCRIDIDLNSGIVETESEAMHAYGYRFFPHLLKGEGFFLAVLRKKDGKEKSDLPLKKYQPPLLKFDMSKYTDSDNLQYIVQNDNLIAIQQLHKASFDYLSTKIKLIKKGILIGKMLPKDVIPSHELALFEKCNYKENIISVDLHTAISYLKKEYVELSLSNKGWYLVTYENAALGWLKNIGNRINNYYPSSYRILSKNTLSY